MKQEVLLLWQKEKEVKNILNGWKNKQSGCMKKDGYYAELYDSQFEKLLKL